MNVKKSTEMPKHILVPVPKLKSYHSWAPAFKG